MSRSCSYKTYKRPYSVVRTYWLRNPEIEHAKLAPSYNTNAGYESKLFALYLKVNCLRPSGCEIKANDNVLETIIMVTNHRAG